MVVVLGGQALVASSASGFHIPGAVYNGTTSAGGAIELTVSPDGSGVAKVVITDPGPTCGFYSITGTFTTPLPIVNHSFNDSSPPVQFAGSFPSKQAAQGTFMDTGISGCSSPLSWTAATTASPAGTEECKNAQTAVSGAQTAVSGAQTAVSMARADVKSEKKAVKRAKRKLAKAEGREAKKARKKLRKERRELLAAQQKLQMALQTLQTAQQTLQTAQAQQAAAC